MKKKQNKKENLFMRLFNRILKLPYLRRFKLGIGWVKGFDVDICREIAGKIFGDKNAIKFLQVTSSTRIFSITSGTVDFAAATMTITPKRKNIIDFSNPYYIAGQAIMVSKDSPVKAFSDLFGKKILGFNGQTRRCGLYETRRDAGPLPAETRSQEQT